MKGFEQSFYCKKFFICYNNPKGCDYMQTKYMTIIFDDGPLPFMCEMVDLFNEYGFKAGFAVMGARINDDTQYMLKYAVDNGFQLVGHSHSHPRLETVTQEQVIAEMTEPVADIKNRIG